MKKHKIILIAVPCIIVICIAAFFIWERLSLPYPERITKETGLVLPPDVRILASSSRIFSTVDGANYAWLIESNNDLSDWITNAHMNHEGGPGMLSWGQVKSFREVAPLAKGKVAQLLLDSVWKSVQQTTDGRSETSLIFLAQDRKIAFLQTFRP